MLKLEKNYDFRKRLCTPHSKKVSDGRTFENCYEFPTKVTIAMSCEGEVATVAAEDFVDYLSVAFGIEATLVKEGKAELAFVNLPTEDEELCIEPCFEIHDVFVFLFPCFLYPDLGLVLLFVPLTFAIIFPPIK